MQSWYKKIKLLNTVSWHSTTFEGFLWVLIWLGTIHGLKVLVPNEIDDLTKDEAGRKARKASVILIAFLGSNWIRENWFLQSGCCINDFSWGDSVSWVIKETLLTQIKTGRVEIRILGALKGREDLWLVVASLLHHFGFHTGCNFLNFRWEYGFIIENFAFPTNATRRAHHAFEIILLDTGLNDNRSDGRRHRWSRRLLVRQQVPEEIQPLLRIELGRHTTLNRRDGAQSVVHSSQRRILCLERLDDGGKKVLISVDVTVDGSTVAHRRRPQPVRLLTGKTHQTAQQKQSQFHFETWWLVGGDVSGELTDWVGWSSGRWSLYINLPGLIWIIITNKPNGLLLLLNNEDVDERNHLKQPKSTLAGKKQQEIAFMDLTSVSILLQMVWDLGVLVHSTGDLRDGSV